MKLLVEDAVYRFLNTSSEAIELGDDVTAELVVENDTGFEHRREHVRARIVNADNAERLHRLAGRRTA